MKRVILLLLSGSIALSCGGCEEGDYLGILERGIRGALNGWDMWATEAVGPYEAPMPPRVEGTKAVTDRHSYQAGWREYQSLSAAVRGQRAPIVYRRYCHHCHGPNGDGRIIVGESLDQEPLDLRDPSIKSDRGLYDYIHGGGDIMPPLGETLAPVEIFLSILYMRSLKDRPSAPFYPPQYVSPSQ